MDTIITREKIKQMFLVDASEHGILYKNGEYKKANKLHKKLHQLYNQAIDLNQVDLFSEFINDLNENIRLWSAIFTLKTNPESAIKALEDLSEDSTIKLTAQTTLLLWYEGKLNLL